MCLWISLHVYQERVWAVSFDCYPFSFTTQLVNSRFSENWQTVRQLTQTTATQEIITHIMVQLCLASLTSLIHKRAIVNTTCLSHKHILCRLSSVARIITHTHIHTNNMTITSIKTFINNLFNSGFLFWV